MKKTTESDSLYNDLEKQSTLELLTNINREDQKVAHAVALELPNIEKFVDACFERMKNGGRLF
ncbi:MAG TPA: N-acetylmuramic acid 6-phosphate etherase, partial [Taishania sp.]|nr:N-acetylmuramic acid 6-phosphate etherase [Taishania sp.]